MSLLEIEDEPLFPEIVDKSEQGLVTIPKANILEVFKGNDSLDPILRKIAQDAHSFTPDVTTAKGRAKIASVAYRVAQAKTYLDGLGKDLVAEMKELPRKIDANRKTMRDFLDALRDEVRAPLTAWEEYQERLAAERKAAEEAAALAKEVEHAHEVALLLDADFDRKREAARVAAEQAQKEREERLAAEAADKARREAEDRAKAEQEATARREQEAIQAAERAKREKEEAEQRLREAEEQVRLAAIKAQEDAEQALLQAIEDERRRHEAEELKVKAELAAREADCEHRKTYNREALTDLLSKVKGLSEEHAKAVIGCIAKNQIRHLKVEY